MPLWILFFTALTLALHSGADRAGIPGGIALSGAGSAGSHSVPQQHQWPALSVVQPDF